MADRTTFNGASTDVPWKNTGMPEGFGDNQARHFKQLYDAAAFPLTAVSGTADDVTATLDPAPDGGGLVDGMKFTLTWAANNTGPMTLALNGGAPVDVLTSDGSVMIADAAVTGDRAMLEFVGGDFRIISGSGSGSGSASPYYIAITASQTWTKPAGYADDALVILEAVGGGKGGGRNQSGTIATGGAGGSYRRREMRYVDVPSSVSVTIGAGGAGATGLANGANGGNTTIGTLLTGPGGEVAAISGGPQWDGGAANSDAMMGGAGGGNTTGSTAGAGGTSVFAGNGGAGGGTGGGLGTPAAGAAPGGGGGASGGAGANSVPGAVGARGEVRIRIIG